MILSDGTIRRLLGEGKLVIQPLDEAQVQPASVDIRLGSTFLAFQRHTSESIDPRERNDALMEPVTVPDGQPFILHPGEFVLGTTLERLTLPDDIVARVEGKALALDTPIPTPSGWATMGDLQPGDRVLDARGRPCAVLRVSPIFLGDDCYEVVFDDRTTIVADADHRWVTWDKRARMSEGKRAQRRALGLNTRGEARPQVRTTHEIAATLLARDGERNHAIDVAALDLPERDLPLEPYILGAWLGDGTTTTAAITVGVEDREHLSEQFAKAGLPLRAIGASITGFSFGHAGLGRNMARNERGQYTANGPAKCLLRDMGVLGSKHIPMAYLRASTAQRLALLQGLMDTDGTLNHGDQAEITLTNKRLIDDVAELIVGLGMKVWRDERPAMLNGKQCGVAYRCRFRPLIDIFRLPRKMKRLQRDVTQTSELRRRFIREVRLVPSQPVRCIEVDAPDGIFLVSRSFIPTHNSSLGRLGLLIHATAGFVDAGWTDGQITLELSNVAPLPIKLWAGMRIGQLSFMQMDAPAERPYGHPSLGSKYQGQSGPVASRYYGNVRGDETPR